MKYKMAFDLPDNETIAKEIKTEPIKWTVWGYSGYAFAKPVKTAKWIKLTGMAPPEYHGHKICSVCESFAPYNPIHPWREMLTPYCPGCGAEMERID